jgi:pyruvate,water dikinase
LRSSTNNEDLPEFNGAGLYESKGFNSKDNDDKLKAKILAVYSSLWSDRAFEEREFFGIDHLKVGMSILIQEAFQKEAANGVIVTTITSTGKVQIIVNSQSGEHSVTNPEENILSESFLINPESGSIEKTYSESSLSPVFIGNKANELQLKQLQEATLKLHNQFTKQRVDAGDKNKYGIDIEFKIMHEKGKNRLYFKQVRLLRY